MMVKSDLFSPVVVDVVTHDTFHLVPLHAVCTNAMTVGTDQVTLSDLAHNTHLTHHSGTANGKELAATDVVKIHHTRWVFLSTVSAGLILECV